MLRLKANYNNFTKQEKKVCDYILNNQKIVTDMSVYELAKKSQSSTGAIMRMIKKAGYSGFMNLKLELAKSESKEYENKGFIVSKNDSVKEVYNKINNIVNDSIKEVYETLNVKDLEKAVQKLLNAKRIFILGVGSSSVAASDLYNKLLRINKNVFFSSDTHMELIMSANSDEADVALAFSYRGMTKEVLEGMKCHKLNKAYTISVTGNKKTPLSKVCDLNLYSPSDESEITIGALASRYSQLFISDLLFLLIAKNDMKKTKEKILKTKKNVDLIK